MTRKPLAILAGILAFFAAAYGTRQVTDWARREPVISREILSRSWVDQPLGTSGVVIRVPWQLESQPHDLPPQVARLIVKSTMLSHEAEGLNVMATTMSFVPGTPMSLEGAADGAIANLRSVNGTGAVNGSKHETSVLGNRGYLIDAKVERERGVPLHMRGLIFLESADMYQLLIVTRDDQADAAAVWEKLLAGVHRAEGLKS